MLQDNELRDGNDNIVLYELSVARSLCHNRVDIVVFHRVECNSVYPVCHSTVTGIVGGEGEATQQ